MNNRSDEERLALWTAAATVLRELGKLGENEEENISLVAKAAREKERLLPDMLVEQIVAGYRDYKYPKAAVDLARLAMGHKPEPQTAAPASPPVKPLSGDRRTFSMLGGTVGPKDTDIGPEGASFIRKGRIVRQRGASDPVSGEENTTPQKTR